MTNHATEPTRAPTPERTRERAAPTWSPQRAQEKWSDRSGRGNFIKAWGVSSPEHHPLSGRVMPKPYGARFEAIQRDPRCARRISPRSVNLDVCRIELGPSRRDPQGTFQNRSGETKNVLQGASAMGSFAVTRCVEETVTVSRRDFGVRVATRSAHANRACLRVAFILNAVCKHASNHQDPIDVAKNAQHRSSRRCSLQNGLAVARASHGARVSGTAHGVHG